MTIVGRMAMRNLLRNRWRSGLAIGGIAIATIMLIWNLAFIDGFYDMMIRGSTDVEIGHVQVQDRRYVERPATIDYFRWDDEVRQAIEGVPGVVAVTPRVRLFGLVGHEERSHIGRIFGVDPRREGTVTVIADGVTQGRWLSDEMPADGSAEAVIGVGLSRTLGVGIGDELVIIAEGADGSMGDGLMEIVGIVESGNSQIDRQAVLLHIEEAQFIAAMDGLIHEAVISVTNPTEAPEMARRIQGALDDIGLDDVQARPWQVVAAGLYELLLLGNQTNLVIYLIIFFIVALGVLNALRMSARERMREFGVMLAVGMSRAKLFGMVIFEGAVLGLVGAGLGGLIGGLLSYYFVVFGMDMGAFMEGDATYMGVSFSDTIHFVMGPATVLTPVIGLILVTTLCSVWPAISSIRLNPRDAITGRQ